MVALNEKRIDGYKAAARDLGRGTLVREAQLSGFEGDAKQALHELSLDNNQSIIKTNAARDLNPDEQKKKDEEKRRRAAFNEMLIILQHRLEEIERQLVELKEQSEALDGVMTALLNGEVVVDEDGKLLDEKAEKAVREYEEKYDTEAVRTDPAVIGRVLNDIQNQKLNLEEEQELKERKVKGIVHFESEINLAVEKDHSIFSAKSVSSDLTNSNITTDQNLKKDFTAAVENKVTSDADLKPAPSAKPPSLGFGS